MSLVYKTLFEVKLMHEYYLTDNSGAAIFALANQPDRLSFLLERYRKEDESVNKDIMFEFPESLIKTYENQGLVLLPSYSGFKVVARVKPKLLADQSLVFEPSAVLAGTMNINVLITRRDNAIDGYTNERIGSMLPGAYFFSNENITGTRTFPFLTNAITPVKTNYAYEQGELATHGANDIRSFFTNTAGEQWSPVPGSGFANENDRMLLPLVFDYYFGDAAGIKEAEFIIKNKTGDTVKTIVMNSAVDLKKARLDLSGKKDALSVPPASSLSDSVFSLEVNASNGFTRSHSVLFSDSFYSKSIWGLVSINAKTTDADFSLFEADGFLKKRKSPLGVWDDHPVFEIPVKSRFAYWRYINDRGRELKLTTDLLPYLDKENKVLLSKSPRAIARSWFLLQKEGSTDTKYLPNPLQYTLKKDEKQRLCFDILVPGSDLFPVIP